MVKQTKTFKKGNVTKKALSAILAASMVMTSSSFVMAAPVEVEDVAVEAAAESVDVVEDVDAGEEESVGVEVTNPVITVGGVSVTKNGTVYETTYSTGYTGAEIKPAVTVENAGVDLTLNKDYTVSYKNNVNAGTATLTISFTKVTYIGEDISINYKINPVELNATNAEVKFTDPGFIYNGKEQKPEIESITVYDKNITAPDKANLNVVAYSNSYDLKTATTQKVKIEDKSGNYSFVGFDCEYTIDKAEFNSKTVTVTCDPVAYNDGKAVAATPVVKTVAGDSLKESKDFEVLYLDKNGKEVSAVPAENASVGTYDIVIKSLKSSENFKADGRVEAKYEIKLGTMAMALKNATVKGKDAKNGVYELDYTGEEQVVEAGSEIAGTTLVKDKDYTVAEKTVIGKDAGTEAQVVLTGINAYAGQSVALNVKIVPAKLQNGYTINASCSKGSDKPFVTITKTGSSPELVLEEGKDYTYTVDSAKKEITITGVGNYTTDNGTDKTIVKSYVVASQILMADPEVVVTVSGTYTYDGGKQITPDASNIAVTYQGKALVKDTDYTITYEDGTTAGKEAGTVVVTGKGKYTGEKKVKFDIVGTDIASKYVLKPISDITVDAKTTLVSPTLLYQASGANSNLVKDTDYAVEYYVDGSKVTAIANPKAGTVVTVKVLGKGAFTGELTQTYKILASDNKVMANMYVEAIADQAYTGKEITPAVIVRIAKDSTKLTEGKDYTVAYSYNTKVGTAYATITGIGDYKGTKVVSFNIVGEMDQTIEVLAAQERDLGNGTRTLNSKATKIKYTTAPETEVTYTSSDENVVTVDAEGNVKYTGIGEATITIEAKAENGYKAVKKEVKVVVTLAKPSFTPFSKNNAFTLTSSTVKGAEKFEVEYATKKDFSNSKTKTFETTSAGKIRQVKVSAADKKTYYVRVRAISGTETSKWSAVKTVATK